MKARKLLQILHKVLNFWRQYYVVEQRKMS